MTSPEPERSDEEDPPASPADLALHRPTVPEAVRHLGLDPAYQPWLAMLASVPERNRFPRPEPAETRTILRRLGLGDQDVDEVVATLPELDRDPALAWLFDRCGWRNLDRMGDYGAPWDPLPALPGEWGAAGRCFPIQVYAATLPASLARFAEVGLPEAVAWATLADLGRHAAIHRRVHGTTGVDAPWWMLLHSRAVIFECGRLQYNLLRIPDGDEPGQLWYHRAQTEALGPGFQAGDAAFGVHIPEGPPLTPDACDDADAMARELLDRCFPVSGRRLATCHSWLLDDQLASYLPARSNIVQFQRRFELVPGYRESDGSIAEFVFRRRPEDLDGVQPRTTLERAVLAHLRSGRHWRTRCGWIDL